MAGLLLYCGKPQAQNVGITDAGSITPNYILQLHKSTNGIMFQLTNGNTSTGLGDGFVVDIDAALKVMFKNQEAGTMAFFTNGTERVTILSGGNVGIGNTNPTYKIDVTGDVNYTGALRISGAAGTTGQILLSQGGAANTWLASGSSGQLLISQGAANPQWQNGSTALATTAWLVTKNTGLTDNTSNFLGTTDAIPIRFITNNTEKMRLLSDGNFGIGTSSAEAINYFNLLTLKGKAAFNSAGTVTTTLGSAVVTGTGTDFLNNVSIGDYITIGGYDNYVSSVASATSLTCVYTWPTIGASVMGIYPSAMRIDRNSGTKNIIIDYFGDIGVNQMYPTGRLHVTEAIAGYNPIVAENSAAAGSDQYSDAIVSYTVQNRSASLWGMNLSEKGTGIMASGNNKTTYYLNQGSGGAFSGRKIGAWGRTVDSTTAGAAFTDTTLHAGLSGLAVVRIAADANMYRAGVFGRIDDNGAGYAEQSAGVLGFNNGYSTMFGALAFCLLNPLGSGPVLTGVYGQTSSVTNAKWGMIGSNYTLYPNIFYNNQDAANDGQTSLYVYRTRSAANTGASYDYTGVNVAISGFNYWGDTYSFGVYGKTYNDVSRNGGVCGYSANGSWGALGYETSAGATYYGGYFVGPLADDHLGTGTGKIIYNDSSSTVETTIGIGAWGDLFGADIHGYTYGLFTEGNNYGLYSKGDIYTNKLNIQLQDVGDRKMAVLYSNVSTDVTVQCSGSAKLKNGECIISYDRKFNSVISKEIPVTITVSPMEECNGLYIQRTDNGFIVKEMKDGKSNVEFSYIAIGRRSGYENPVLPEEVISANYLTILNTGFHNDGDTLSDGVGLYFKNKELINGPIEGEINVPKKTLNTEVLLLNKNINNSCLIYKKENKKSLESNLLKKEIGQNKMKIN